MVADCGHSVAVRPAPYSCTYTRVYLEASAAHTRWNARKAPRNAKPCAAIRCMCAPWHARIPDDAMFSASAHLPTRHATSPPVSLAPQLPPSLPAPPHAFERPKHMHIHTHTNEPVDSLRRLQHTQWEASLGGRAATPQLCPPSPPLRGGLSTTLTRPLSPAHARPRPRAHMPSHTPRHTPHAAHATPHTRRPRLRPRVM